MRNAMIDRLARLAAEDPDILLITGDLGYGALSNYIEKFPSQFINAGIAEQNMMGMAAGFALEGRKVFTYSIGNFATLRCIEQLRVDVAYHNLNVNVICVGGGFSYGEQGVTHHATEDLTIMRSIPNMDVLLPSSTWEAGEATSAMVRRNNPGYIRIDKSGIRFPPRGDDVFEIGKARTICSGNDIAIIAAGGIAEEAVEASSLLRADGVDCRVISIRSLKPLDEEIIILAATETNGIITLEENVIQGGLGSAVAEICIKKGVLPNHFAMLGLDNQFSSIVGSQKYLRKHYEIDASAVIKAARKMR